MSAAPLPTRFRATRPVGTALALALSLVLGACATGPRFETPAEDFKGRVGVVDAPQVLPGATVQMAGRGFVPGQQVQLSYGGVALGGSATADAEGNFRTAFTVPANAPAGQHPLVVNATRPVAALVYPLKVSPLLPESGQDRFDARSQKLAPGLYQAAYSARSGRVFVTAASGRPPVSASELLKVDPRSLAIEARVKPGAAPASGGGAARAPGVFAVYGVGVDDTQGHVWVTNTRQNTVAVYRQSDLALVKQFAPGAVDHARDVVVDGARGRAFVSPVGHPFIKVFDTRTMQALPDIRIDSTVKGPNAKDFSPMSLALDAATGKLYTVSLSTGEVAVVDTPSGQVDKVFVVEGAKSAVGIGYDPRTRRILVASQGGDNLLIADAATGKVLHDVKLGAGPLNVAVDSARGLAYVPVRGAGTVAVVSMDGKIVANLPGGANPNHAAIDDQGTVFAVNKGRGQDDPTADRITRITPR